MTDYERDQKLVRDACNGALVIDNGRYVIAPEQLRRFATLAFAAGSRSDTRPCTCHPDDNPPKPCPKKYALSECRAAGEDARDAARYRWLREHKRYRLACVLDLHGWKASGEDHDAAIDTAMGGNDAHLAP